jgi:phenylacetate-CoA ligase
MLSTAFVRHRAVTAAEADAAGRQLVALIKNTIGVSVATVVQDPDTIERSLGKMRRIIDERLSTQ